jgi:hypothetical protein
MNALSIHFIGFRIVMLQIPVVSEPASSFFSSKLNEIMQEWLRFMRVLRQSLPSWYEEHIRTFEVGGPSVISLPLDQIHTYILCHSEFSPPCPACLVTADQGNQWDQDIISRFLLWL